MTGRLLLGLAALGLTLVYVRAGQQMFLSGALGSDYTYFLPRLVYGYFWQVENGFTAVPWFAPAWCGGLPFYADPQVMFHSIPQWLLWLVDPVQALFVTWILFGLAGAIGMYLLLRSRFDLDVWLAFTGAALFAFNEFYLFRMMTGHFTNHVFMLMPWIAWALAGTAQPGRGERWGFILLSGGLIALVIHGGAANLLVPLLLSVSGILLLYCLQDPARFGGLIVSGSAACLIALMLSAAKLVPAWAFVAAFPREGISLGLFDGFLDAFLSVLTMLYAGPWITLKEMTSAYAVQQHELRFGVTIVPLLLLLAGLVSLPSLLSRLTITRSLLILALLLLMCVPVVLSIRSPLLDELLRQLPYFREMSLAVRWVVLLIPLAIVIPLLLVRPMTEGSAHGARVRAGIALGTTLVIAVSHLATDRPQDIPYDPAAMLAGYDAVRQGGAVPAIDRVTAYPSRRTFSGVDDDFLVGGSSQVCYQPLFGYRLESFPLNNLRPGSIYGSRAGRLNFKRPECYLYSRHAGCRPGEHYQTAQADDLALFATNQVLDWPRPWYHQTAVWVNLLSLVLIILALPVLLLARMLKAGGGRGN